MQRSYDFELVVVATSVAVEQTMPSLEIDYKIQFDYERDVVRTLDNVIQILICVTTTNKL